MVAAIGCSFGGINLDDIKAPECSISSETAGQLDIPVFHDDQHGTAIISSAGLLNVLEITGKKLEEIRAGLVNGGGAAALACANPAMSLEDWRPEREHLVMCDTPRGSGLPGARRGDE